MPCLNFTSIDDGGDDPINDMVSPIDVPPINVDIEDMDDNDDGAIDGPTITSYVNLSRTVGM
jgi:hypothetical protein